MFAAAASALRLVSSGLVIKRSSRTLGAKSFFHSAKRISILVCAFGSERKLVKGAHNKAAALSEQPNISAAAAAPTSFSLYQPQAASGGGGTGLFIDWIARIKNEWMLFCGRPRVARICAVPPAKHHQTFTAKEHCVFRVLINFQFARRQPQRRACLFWTRQTTCAASHLKD